MITNRYAVYCDICRGAELIGTANKQHANRYVKRSDVWLVGEGGRHYHRECWLEWKAKGSPPRLDRSQVEPGAE